MEKILNNIAIFASKQVEVYLLLVNELFFFEESCTNEFVLRLKLFDKIVYNKCRK